MLEHADARDLVERTLALEVAVILHADFAHILQPFLDDSLAREFMLVLAQGDARRACPVLLRCTNHQGAPAAAYVQESLARTEHELVEDMVEFLFLGLLQRVAVGAVVCAGIDQVAVQPQRVEIVRNVVVILDRVAVAAAVVTGEALESLSAPGRGMPRKVFGNAEHVEYRSFDAQIPLDVGSAELHQVWGQEKSQRRRAGNADLDRGVYSEIEGAAVPKLQAQRECRRRLESPHEPLDATF